jgi:hypothetical protein
MPGPSKKLRLTRKIAGNLKISFILSAKGSIYF